MCEEDCIISPPTPLISLHAHLFIHVVLFLLVFVIEISKNRMHEPFDYINLYITNLKTTLTT